MAKGSRGGECGQDLLHLGKVRKESGKEGGRCVQNVVVETQLEPRQSGPALSGALLQCGRD